MSPTSLEKEIYDFIKTRGAVSFAELRSLPGFTGEFSFELEPNLVLWSGMSPQAVEAINALVQSGRIQPTPTSPFTYFADGAALKLPLAKRVRPYKKRRWLPIVFNVPRKRKP